MLVYPQDQPAVSIPYIIRKSIVSKIKFARQIIIIKQVADKYDMTWRLYFSNKTPRAALFVSKLSHCFFDILSNTVSGNWKLEIPLIISNHETLRPFAEKFGIEFHQQPELTSN